MCHQNLLSPLGMGAEREGRLQLVVFYRARDESELNLEEKEREGHLMLACLLCCCACFLVEMVNSFRAPMESLQKVRLRLRKGGSL